VWATPVLAAQWWFATPAVRRRRRTFLLAVGVPTLWLWVADRVAIGAGIWSISPRFTTGAHLFGLPAEEALFFLVTNLLVVQGLLLFLQPALVAAGAPPDAASRVRAQRAA
jgi:lycopene beta-cyclase